MMLRLLDVAIDPIGIDGPGVGSALLPVIIIGAVVLGLLLVGAAVTAIVLAVVLSKKKKPAESSPADANKEQS